MRDLGPVETLRPLPEWAGIAQEMKRKGVTLMLLWQEYRAAEPTGYGYSQFAEHYRRWRMTIDPVMRQEHRAGERTFVDYAGLTVDIFDAATGEIRTAQIFVAAPRVGGAVAEEIFANGLCLPSGSNLTEEQHARVCKVLLSLFKANV